MYFLWIFFTLHCNLRTYMLTHHSIAFKLCKIIWHNVPKVCICENCYIELLFKHLMYKMVQRLFRTCNWTKQRSTQKHVPQFILTKIKCLNAIFQIRQEVRSVMFEGTYQLEQQQWAQTAFRINHHLLAGSDG